MIQEQTCFSGNRSSHRRCSLKKAVLRNFTKFTGKHLCQSFFFKKETLAQVFPCEFCDISNNTFLHKTPLVAASAEIVIQTILSLQEVYQCHFIAFY